MTRRILPRLAQLVALSSLLAFAMSLAAHHPDPATATESRYLALLGGLVLVGLSISRRTVPQVVAAASAGALVLALPAAQGTRGALFVAVLVAATAWSTWGALGPRARPALVDFAGIVIAWQALLRSDRLLELELHPKALVWLLLLPIAAGAAATWLTRESDRQRALPALAPMLLLAPGVAVVPTAVLAIAAAGSTRRPSTLPNALWLVAASVVAIWRSPEVGMPILLLVACLVMSRIEGWQWLPAGGAVVWAASSWILADSPGSTTGVALVLLAFPAILLCPRERVTMVVTALALAAAHHGGQDPVLLAPAIALLALSLPTDRAGGGQAAWSTGLLGLGALTAAYPWLRRPLLDSPEEVAGVPLATLAVALLFGGWALSTLSSNRLLARAAAALALALVLLAPRSAQTSLLDGQAVTIDGSTNRWDADLDPQMISTVTLDSFLSRGGELSGGRPIGALRLWTPDGDVRERILHQGRDTADWAAGRLEHSNRPPPWLSWVAADGALAQRYRTVWQLDEPFPTERVEVVLFLGLPGDPELSLLSVRVR